MNKKEIVVLSGGGRRGVVKIFPSEKGENFSRVECSLDFRPKGATLFLIGEQIAKMAVDNVNCADEVPFCANDNVCLVLRSSSLTMFGGGGNKSEMLKRIDAFLKENAGEKKEYALDGKGEEEQKENGEVKECTPEKEPCGKREESGEKEPCGKREESGEKERIDEWERCRLGEIPKYEGDNFYGAVKAQIDELFVCYPLDEGLCKAVEGSKWVRVNAGEGFYVVGILTANGEPKYICYGVPEKAGDEHLPPKDIEGVCEFLPVCEKDIKGFWVICQSAKTAEIERLNS